MPDVARRGSTPRRGSARTWAAVPAAPPNGAAVATALPTSWVDATNASDGVGPRPSSISRRCSTQVRYEHRGLRDEQRDAASTSRSRPAGPTPPAPRGPTAPGGRRPPPPRIQGSAAANHRPHRGRVGRPDRGGIDHERVGHELVGDVGHGGFHQVALQAQTIGPRALDQKPKGSGPGSGVAARGRRLMQSFRRPGPPSMALDVGPVAGEPAPDAGGAELGLVGGEVERRSCERRRPVAAPGRKWTSTSPTSPSPNSM